MNKMLPLLCLLIFFFPRPLHARYAPEIKRQLLEVVEKYKNRPGRKVAVFDFDNTLIFNDISYAVVYHLISRKLITTDPRALRKIFPEKMAKLYLAIDNESTKLVFLTRYFKHYRRMCKSKGKPACLSWLAGLYIGFTPKKLREIVQIVIGTELSHRLCHAHLDQRRSIRVNRGLRIYETQRRLIALLKKRGFEVWIVSASNEALVEVFARYFSVPPERVLGVRPQVVAGRYNGKVIPPVTYRRGKVKAIKKYIGLQPLLVFGDAVTDKEMLEYAKERAVLIDRGNRDILAIARKQGWLIQKAFIDPGKVPSCFQGRRPFNR